MSTDVDLATKKCHQLTAEASRNKNLFWPTDTRLLAVQVDLSAHFSGASISYSPCKLASGSAKS
jgi:hypothetical protein